MSVDEIVDSSTPSLVQTPIVSGPEPDRPLGEPSARGRRDDFLQGFAGNLRKGLRVAALRPTGPDQFRLSADQVVALALLDLALTFVRDFARGGPAGTFDPSALPGQLFPITLLLFAGYLIASLQGDQVGPLALSVIVLSASPIAYGVYLLCDVGMKVLPPAVAPTVRLGFFILFTAWLILMDIIAVRSVAGRWSMRAARDTAIFLAVAFVPLWLLPPSELWVAPPEPEPAPAQRAERWPSVVREDILHRQPELLRRELAALKSQRPGVIDLYFVGFGGYAHQDVFMKEVETIRKLFDERFGTAGRSLALINNPKTVGRLPIATASNLAETLKHIGRLMDREEDVLFLYLTSHGSESHELSVTYWPLELKQIDPRTLKDLLDGAGIKWRVVVVSACYSGGFIEPLKNESTFIATAAAADRQSFGCSNENDFTYFGQAYFDDALRRTTSFVDAFQLAKARIGLREGEERKTPSNPQLYVGAAIKPVLERHERRLEAEGRR